MAPNTTAHDPSECNTCDYLVRACGWTKNPVRAADLDYDTRRGAYASFWFGLTSHGEAPILRPPKEATTDTKPAQ